MKRTGILAAGYMASACAFGAEAGLQDVPSVDAACVKLVAGAAASPVYPEALYERKLGGDVRLEIRFSDSESAPRVRTLTNSGGIGLNEAAERFATQYRYTCMKPGDKPVTIQQDFRFVPDDGRKVAWTVPAYTAANSPTADRKCVKHLQPDSTPEYPRGATRANANGRVVTLLTFTEIDKPPQVAFPVPGPRNDFTEAVREWSQGYRLTCGGTPLTALQVFDFRMPGNDLTVLRDTNLKSFLRGATNATAAHASFDLGTMGCPFDVRFEYWQPAFRNRVGEVGPPVPSRLPFLEWLSGLRLSIPPQLANAVVGESLTISVPCGKIDL